MKIFRITAKMFDDHGLSEFLYEEAMKLIHGLSEIDLKNLNKQQFFISESPVIDITSFMNEIQEEHSFKTSYTSSGVVIYLMLNKEESNVGASVSRRNVVLDNVPEGLLSGLFFLNIYYTEKTLKTLKEIAETYKKIEKAYPKKEYKPLDLEFLRQSIQHETQHLIEKTIKYNNDSDMSPKEYGKRYFSLSSEIRAFCRSLADKSIRRLKQNHQEINNINIDKRNAYKLFNVEHLQNELKNIVTEEVNQFFVEQKLTQNKKLQNLYAEYLKTTMLNSMYLLNQWENQIMTSLR